jgi:lipoate-protein ligase A
VDTGPGAAAWNMGVDEALLVAAATSPLPVLRFYTWRPPAVSLGYFQRPERELDLEALRRLGLEWVRRPTGGRAVLHDDELTYSVVIREEHLAGTVIETYRVLSQALVCGLRGLGLDAEVMAHSQLTGRRVGESAACFDAPSWYEVVAGDRKVVGSAQMRRQGVILQHGSVPLTMDNQRLAAVLRLPSERARARVARLLGDKAGGIADVLGRRPALEEVKAALRKGFESALGVVFVAGQLVPAEAEAARRLAQTRYSMDQEV